MNNIFTTKSRWRILTSKSWDANKVIRMSGYYSPIFTIILWWSQLRFLWIIQIVGCQKMCGWSFASVLSHPFRSFILPYFSCFQGPNQKSYIKISENSRNSQKPEKVGGFLGIVSHSNKTIIPVAPGREVVRSWKNFIQIFTLIPLKIWPWIWPLNCR